MTEVSVQCANLLLLGSESVEMLCRQNHIAVHRVVLLPVSVFVSERGRERRKREAVDVESELCGWG